MGTNIDFLSHAFAGISPDEMPWVAGFPGDVAAAPHSVWFGAPAIPLPTFIRARNNNYVCISTFKCNDEGQYRRRKDCWAGLWLVMLDDLGTKIPFDKLLLEPSWLVESSPENWQAWLMLKSPERDYTKAEALINGLIAAGASDPGAGNLTRYGRLPVGCNGKAKYAGKCGAPFVQSVHTAALDRRYTVEEIAAAYRINLTAPARPTARSTPAARHGKADPFIGLLAWAGLYLGEIRGTEGGHRITCPWQKVHTNQDTTGTAYWSPSEDNNGKGGFVCHHGHCRGRGIHDLNNFVAGLVSLREEKRAAG